MAAIPHRHVWVSFENNVLYFGGRSVKDKVGFERLIKAFETQLTKDFGEPKPEDSLETQPNADAEIQQTAILQTTDSQAQSSTDADAQKTSSPTKQNKKELAASATGSGNTENAQGDS